MRLSVATLVLLLAAAVSPAIAGGITVPMDEVRTIAFDRPIATVYVGNPSVADVTMIDSTHAFILGKSFGATNLLALDAKGGEVADQHIIVLDRGEAIVTLNRGAAQVTYACATSRCESAPIPGDDKAAFDATMGQISTHQDMGAKAATVAH